MFYIGYSRKFKNQHELLEKNDPELGLEKVRSDQSKISKDDKIPNSLDNWQEYSDQQHAKMQLKNL